MSRSHVVVLGGGFGGLSTIQALRGRGHRITLVDPRNHHLFQPLLYQVASAALAPSDIAEPLRGILSNRPDVEVRRARAERIDVEARLVHLDDGATLSYDQLVVAAGAVTSYFGHDRWAAHAPGLKSLGDALDLRHRLLNAFERAEWTDDPDARRRLLTFVVVGGGPTGVEVAGAIREIACQTLAPDFRHVDLHAVRVVLVEGRDVLGPFPDDLRASAKAQLERLGVEIRTGTNVADVGDGWVQLGDERLEAGTIVWAAGVQAAPVAATVQAEHDRAGRVVVQPDLSLPGHPEVFVIGDMAHVATDDGGTVPGVAPAALQMGQHVAACLRADAAGRPRPVFRYVDRGSLATIGRSRAVASLPFGLHLTGWIAWVIWVFVHLMTLVGHRNRVVVFLKWAWAWVTNDRSSRLLWRDEDGPPRREQPGG